MYVSVCVHVWVRVCVWGGAAVTGGQAEFAGTALSRANLRARKTSAVRSSLPCPEAQSPPGLACKRATVN